MTIKDVARYCGVSVSTVSRVINNHPDVSKDKRDKILAAMQELHYVPNTAARDLVKTGSDSIGIIVKGRGNVFYANVINTIEDGIKDTDYTLHIHEIDTDMDELEEGARLIKSKRLRGLIFLGGRFDHTEDAVKLINIPFVYCTFTNRFGNLALTEYSSVTIDDTNESRKAVNYLIDRGHKRIGMVLHKKDDSSISELRFQGYKAALDEAGIELDDKLIQETGTYHLQDVYRATTELIERNKDMTAMFVISDTMAMVALRAIYDAGLRVPEDCSVISIDGIEISKYTVPSLTTLEQPQRELGLSALNSVFSRIEGRTQNAHHIVETYLRRGETVRDIN